MRMKGKVVGSISVFTSRPEHVYTAEDEGLLQDLADRAGLTLASAQLYQENLRQGEELRRSNEQLEQRVFERTRELEEANAKLFALATHDPLTGLANRRRFNDVLEQEIRRCRRTQRPLALLMLDIVSSKDTTTATGISRGMSA